MSHTKSTYSKYVSCTYRYVAYYVLRIETSKSRSDRLIRGAGWGGVGDSPSPNPSRNQHHPLSTTRPPTSPTHPPPPHPTQPPTLPTDDLFIPCPMASLPRPPPPLLAHTPFNIPQSHFQHKPYGNTHIHVPEPHGPSSLHPSPPCPSLFATTPTTHHPRSWAQTGPMDVVRARCLRCGRRMKFKTL